MRVLLVRHARAGDRRDWDGDDRIRPLDKKGRRQAKAIAKALTELGAERLLSSSYLRCTQTLEPAAQKLGVPIEERDELAEGSARSDVLRLVDGLSETAALCTHGDVLEALFPGRSCQKGSIWVVDVRDGELSPERYVPPDAR
jgi:phosphohistidine phosphatase SixA